MKQTDGRSYQHILPHYAFSLKTEKLQGQDEKDRFLKKNNLKKVCLSEDIVIEKVRHCPSWKLY